MTTPSTKGVITTIQGPTTGKNVNFFISLQSSIFIIYKTLQGQFLLVLILVFCNIDTIAEVIGAQTQLSTLLDAVLQFKDLTDTLTKPGAGTFTVFAPDNAAFEEIKDTVANLSKDELKKVLKNHIVAGRKIMAAELKEGTLKTLAGDLKVENDNGKFKFGVVMAEIVGGMVDMEAKNGVVHVINKVLTGNSITT